LVLIFVSIEVERVLGYDSELELAWRCRESNIKRKLFAGWLG
jgi:hypothetical protein